MDKIIIDSEYHGYIYVGEAHGRFENQRGEKVAYHQLFVISPVSSFKSDDYEAHGFKAEKFNCVSGSVLEQGFQPGDKLQLFFDNRQRVQMVALAE